MSAPVHDARVAAGGEALGSLTVAWAESVMVPIEMLTVWIVAPDGTSVAVRLWDPLTVAFTGA